MGLAGGIVALRRHVAVSVALLLAILLAALTMPSAGEVLVAGQEPAPAQERTVPTPTTAPTTAPPTGPVLADPVPAASTRPSALAPGTTVPDPPAASGPAPATTLAPAGEPPRCSSLPKASGGQWRCTFSDEFEGTVLDDRKWIPQTTRDSGFKSGNECFVDSPRNLSISGGTLRLTVRAEPAVFDCSYYGAEYYTRYTSGMVMTYQRFTQAFGRFEVRAKVPRPGVKGLQSSFWMWPEDPLRYGPWPMSGEIDIAEFYSLHPDLVIPYLHYIGIDANSAATRTDCVVEDVSQFHTYAVEWTTESITFIYDGKICFTSIWTPVPPMLRPQPFDQPFMIALTQAMGIGANAFDPAITPLPATTEIDYVRVWR